jgi:hypothetical protein
MLTRASHATGDQLKINLLVLHVNRAPFLEAIQIPDIVVNGWVISKPIDIDDVFYQIGPSHVI